MDHHKAELETSLRSQHDALQGEVSNLASSIANEFQTIRSFGSFLDTVFSVLEKKKVNTETGVGGLRGCFTNAVCFFFFWREVMINLKERHFV